MFPNCKSRQGLCCLSQYEKRVCLRKLLRCRCTLLVSVLLLGLFYFHYALNGERMRYSCDVSEMKNDRLRLLIYTVSRALEKRKVTHWLDYGSLLGAYRYVDKVFFWLGHRYNWQNREYIWKLVNKAPPSIYKGHLYPTSEIKTLCQYYCFQCYKYHNIILGFHTCLGSEKWGWEIVCNNITCTNQ